MQPLLPTPGDDVTLTQSDIHDKILAEAGGNLYFLQPFVCDDDEVLEAGWTWEKARKAFELSPQHSNAIKHLGEFINAVKDKRERLRSVLAMWLCCTRRSAVTVDDAQLYDARYFWVANGVGHTVCGLVDAFVLQEVEKQQDGDISLTNNDFMHIIKTLTDNRSAQGFLVERSVLAFLRMPHVMRRLLGQLQFLPTSHPNISVLHHKYFPAEPGGSIDPQFLDATSRFALYIPQVFNFQAVDGVIRIIQPPPTLKREPQRRSNRQAAAKKAQASTDKKERDKDKSKKRKLSQKQQPRADKEEAEEEEEEAEEEEEEAEEEGEEKGEKGATGQRDVTLIALQITLGKVTAEKQRRTTRFFDTTRFWTHDIPQARVTFALVYVVQDEPRTPPTTGQCGNITYAEHHVTLAQIDHRLDAAVRGM